MKTKIGIVSLGCAKNQVDAEIMAGMLTEKGYAITGNAEQAEIIIVNTCGFIDDAKQEAIDTILEMAEYKKSGRCRSLIVTGCLAQRYFDDIRESLPEVDAILGVGQYKEICEAIEGVVRDGGYFSCGEDLALDYLNESRIPFTPKGSAYLKIAEGCDNRCSYCAIPNIRGPFRSRPPEDILQEANRLVAAGVKELVVVAQDTTRYGLDLYGEPYLSYLLTELNKIPDLRWIRLLYLYPDEVTKSLIDTMRDCEKVLPYVDLPLQHISDRLLRNMNRRGTSDYIRQILRYFREQIPDVIIRTSFIVGYPTETEDDFALLEKFIKETEFDRMGIFKYSKEAGTAAEKKRPHVRDTVKQNRYEILMRLQREISRKKNQLRVGRVYDTLVEGVAEDGIFYIGRTYAESPEVDGKVYFTSPEPLEIGDMVRTKILIAEEYDFTGEAVTEA